MIRTRSSAIERIANLSDSEQDFLNDYERLIIRYIEKIIEAQREMTASHPLVSVGGPDMVECNASLPEGFKSSMESSSGSVAARSRRRECEAE